MSAFGGMYLTNKGKALQTKAQTGITINFTRIAVGDGELGSSLITDLNSLKNEIKSLDITKLKILNTEKAVVGSVLSNQGLENGFYYRELGVFAQDPDEGEILYCYGNAGANAEYITAGGGADIIEKVIDIITIVGNAADVSAVIDESLAYLTVPRYESEQGLVDLETVETQVRPAINELNTKTNDILGYTRDGFANYVKDIEPAGGVKRIWYDDPAIEYSDNSLKDNNSRRVLNNGSVKLSFEGTSIYLTYLKYNQTPTFDVYIDGTLLDTKTLPTNDQPFPNEVLFELAVGLSDSKHTLEIKNINSEGDGIFVQGFDIIQTTNNTSKTNAGTSYIDSEKQEVLEDTQSYTTPTTGRQDLLVVGKDCLVSVAEGTDGQGEKAFRVEEDGTISREYVKDIPEWLKEVKVWNSGQNSSSNGGWSGRNYLQSSNKTLLVTGLTDATFYIGFYGTGLDFITIESSTQGIFTVSIDGGVETTFDNYNSITQYQVKKTIADNLPMGYHEAKILVTGNQNVSATGHDIHVDAFDIHLPATPELPQDTQALAKVYLMPSPATMVSIPSRPTSSEEKGWVRYESDMGCRYVGSSWVSGIGTGYSNNGYIQSGGTNDFVEFTFIGDGVRFISNMYSNKGIAEISIDDVVQETIDLYSSSSQIKVVAFEITGLPNNKHTIQVKATGTKNASATDTQVLVDAFEVHRPLYLTDIRSLSPVRDKDLYEIEFKSHLKDPKANGKLGEVLDHHTKYGNLYAKIVNEFGTAYLYNDGRVTGDLRVSFNTGSGGGVVTVPFELPVLLADIEEASLSYGIYSIGNFSGTPQQCACKFIDNGRGQYWFNEVTFNTNATLSIHFEGRWY